MAEALVGELTGASLFSDAPNGLFLAAPRRTGKSTFLQNELQPALEKTGRVVVYVDLWSDRGRNPGTLIADALGRELGKHLGIVARAAKSAGLEHVGLAGWLKVDTTKIGRIDGLTLVDALRALRETAGKPVALIIDEAQHALTSMEGEAAMTSLKSARDQLNRPGEANLLLIMSGSDRDKLLRLVNSHAAPFFGSAISRLPLLGEDFIAHVVSLITSTYPLLGPINAGLLWDAFQRLGNRPQPFVRLLGQVLSPLAPPTSGFEQRILELAEMQRAEDERRIESAYLALRPVEQAVLWRMLEQGDRFRPYDAEALAFIAKRPRKRLPPRRRRTPLKHFGCKRPRSSGSPQKVNTCLMIAGW